MDVRRFEDPAAYAEEVLRLLLRAPARHNLYLGILDILQRHPATYPAFHLWSAQDGDEVIAAAMQTPPHNLVLSEPAMPGAIESLVAGITDAGVRPPGVVGGLTEARAFASAWSARHGGSHHTVNRQGIYELATIRDPGSGDGTPRPATGDDLPLLIAWHEAFLAEAAPHHIRHDEMMRRRLTGMVADESFWLWEAAGQVVSMTGASAAPPNGVRIGPVFTPPALRGRGYATALVARVSKHALGQGNTRCYLHTDMANPTSNAIYQRIGYEWVCEATEIGFSPD
ncbi:MAG TPA: GNAT family N-acetyltransferase [Actinomycetota bacterium]|nr:GNAT family N-acetyltransferase [Actinomycetota bacterium]